ncbi:Cysteine synthase 2, partial [Coemansia sp. RSA 2598]
MAQTDAFPPAYVLLAATAAATAALYRWWQQQQQQKGAEQDTAGPHGNRTGVVSLIGNTPLIRINSLSDHTGCEILAKAEFLNPGGSSKDRIALYLIEQAESQGKLTPHTQSCIFEGTSGSTGISLAMVARAKGYLCHIVMPSDQAIEKSQLLERYGATVERVAPCSIVDRNNFVNVARRRAMEYGGDDRSGRKKGYFVD